MPALRLILFLAPYWASNQRIESDSEMFLPRQIASTDEEIDGLVYALYGLTVEEIAIVEGAAEG